MAAGCTIAEGGFARFDAALRQMAGEWLVAATLTRPLRPLRTLGTLGTLGTLRTDGPLAFEWFNSETVAMLDAQVWGQGFEAPLFCDEVDGCSSAWSARSTSSCACATLARYATPSGSAMPSRCRSA